MIFNQFPANLYPAAEALWVIFAVTDVFENDLEHTRVQMRQFQGRRAKRDINFKSFRVMLKDRWG
ncbi:MAG TPA: hypothetical protein DEH25_18400 [Chloroflexi bacterium]|nr:hypothetical protein [Chloroflexota bacterium]HBY09623.1 hypothetical protein [Chloroflexota bacterium]